MAALLILLAILAIAGVTAAVVFFANLARHSKRDYDASNQVVPGRPTSVPASWAGSHDAAALLHRRLVAAMAALRANQAFDDDGGLIDLRVELEQQTLAIDERLVAVAALPATVRPEPLRQVTEATAAIERAVGNLANRSVADLRPHLEATVADLHQRSGVLDEIRRQLDATDAGNATMDVEEEATEGPAPDTSAAGPAPAAGLGPTIGPVSETDPHSGTAEPS